MSELNNFYTRDFRGYGQFPPNPNWPGKAKVAVSFVVNYEEGGEHTILNGDSKSEVFLNETPGGTACLQRDINMETQYEYGSRCGVWRILRIFQKYARKFTCYAVGKAVEVNPGAILAMVKDGHEIASHNHRWIDYAIVDEDTERQHVRDCIDAIKKASGGIVPVGWYTGRVGVHSRRIVWDEYKKYTGKSLLYECDAYNDDLPYWVDMKEEDEEGLLVIPYTLDQNDMKFCVPPGFTDPSGFFNYLKNAFDVLYEEASTSAPHPTPKLMSVGLHCRLAGKPGRAAALDQFLKYLSTFGDDVWVATRQEIAEHWRREFPYIKK